MKSVEEVILNRKEKEYKNLFVCPFCYSVETEVVGSTYKKDRSYIHRRTLVDYHIYTYKCKCKCREIYKLIVVEELSLVSVAMDINPEPIYKLHLTEPTGKISMSFLFFDRRFPGNA